MGDEQRRELATVLSQDEAFKAAMASAQSMDDAVRLARERGIEVSVEDLVSNDGDLSDADLESAAGGTRFEVYPTDYIFCVTRGNLCTMTPRVCGQA